MHSPFFFQASLFRFLQEKSPTPNLSDILSQHTKLSTETLRCMEKSPLCLLPFLHFMCFDSCMICLVLCLLFCIFLFLHKMPLQKCKNSV